MYKAGIAAAAMIMAWSQSSSAQSTSGVPASPASALAECVSMQTSGADRLLTAQWLFAAMSKSPRIANLASITDQQHEQLNKAFGKLLVRIVTQDCLAQVRPLAAKDMQSAFEQVGGALGEVAMRELLGSQEVEKSVSAYTAFLSEEDFKPLTDTLPDAQEK